MSLKYEPASEPLHIFVPEGADRGGMLSLPISQLVYSISSWLSTGGCRQRGRARALVPGPPRTMTPVNGVVEGHEPHMTSTIWTGKVDIRLPGKGNSDARGARSV
jgi:hypothetical protein